MPLNRSLSIGSLASGMFNLRGDSSKFLVVFDDANYDLGSWSKVTGLSVTWDSIPVRVGDKPDLHVVPGLPKYANLVLTRATCTDSATVQRWLAETARHPRSFSGSIQLLSWAGVALVQWDFASLFPVAWRIADLDSKAATVVIETLELAHTGFTTPATAGIF